ncbi:MAG: hypothetical protein J5850_06490, partial [Clostridia bacterium]|nr:hypothetical protein [Clostridia bacterium]
MKRIISLLLVIVILGLSLSACADVNDIRGKTANNPYQNQQWAQELSNLNAAEITKFDSKLSESEFDTKLISFISERTEGNYMVSPLSFRYALGLLIAGANGETQAELLKALGVETVDEWTEYCRIFNGFVKAFDQSLQNEIEEFTEMKKRGYIDKDTPEPFRALRVANSVWKRDDITEDFKDAYKEYIEKNYAAEYRYFTRSNAVSLINDWAKIKTEGMIPRLLPDEYDTSSLAIVLMNALYFKDTWVHEFEKYASKEEDFTTEKGEIVKKTFMHTTESFEYYEDENTQLVVLPMAGGVYMAVVLGDTGNLSEKIRNTSHESVKLSLPKFEIESSFDNQEFVNFLKENGVKAAFEGKNADFTNMIQWDLTVTDIVQKTKIKIDEDGVEAAAVTAIMLNDEACPIFEEPVVFNADRPVSFYIYTNVNDMAITLFA